MSYRNVHPVKVPQSFLSEMQVSQPTAAPKSLSSVLGRSDVCSRSASSAGTAGKATTRMNYGAADGSMTARKVDWIRPAKDITVVAGEQPTLIL